MPVLYLEMSKAERPGHGLIFQGKTIERMYHFYDSSDPK